MAGLSLLILFVTGTVVYRSFPLIPKDHVFVVRYALYKV